MPEKRALVAVCHNMPFVFTKSAQSLVEFGWGDRIPYCREKLGFENIHFRWFGSLATVDGLRNKAARSALEGGYTHLVFLDADMVWPETAIYQILSHADSGDIVGGLYVLKGPPYSPVHLLDGFRQDDQDMFLRAVDYKDELVEVEVLGMGLTIIPVQAFRDIPGPRWFEYRYGPDELPTVSEDVPFSQKARAAGYKLFMDPTISCGHVGVEVYDQRHHRRYQQSVEATQEMGAPVTIKAAG